MNELRSSINWEEFFIQEAVELEEKMISLDVESLSKSKLRLCLENNILEWPDYERWTMSRLGCSSLKMSLSDEELEPFIDSAKMNLETYSHCDFWGEDLIPFVTWDNQLIVLGLQYNENLISIENHIFILAPPHLLSYISLRLHNAQRIENDKNEELIQLEESKSMSKSILDGFNLDLNAKSAFTKEESFFQPNAFDQNKSKDGLWELISDRENEFNFEAKKQFEAFIILKLDQNQTRVFKMDPELSKQGVSHLIFEYNLNDSKPFKKVFESGKTEVFSLQDLHMNLSPFQHACLTPLKRGKNTIGFFIGLKTDQASTQDKLLLEELAQDIAS